MKYLRISDTLDAYKNNVISEILDTPNVTMVAKKDAFFDPYEDYSVESVECPPDAVRYDTTTADILVTMSKNKKLTNGDILGKILETFTKQVTFDKNEGKEPIMRFGKFDHLGKIIHWNVLQKYFTYKFIGDHGGMLATFNFDGGINNLIGGYKLYSKLQTIYLDGKVYDIDDLVVNVAGGSGSDSDSDSDFVRGLDSDSDSGSGSGSFMRGIAFPDDITGEHEVEFVLDLGSDEIDSDATLDISGKGWFNNCLGMTSVTLPKFIGGVNNYTFKGSNNITTAIVDSECLIQYNNMWANFTTIFGGNSYVPASVINVIIGDSVTSIGSSAFYGCSGLTSITIPDSVTSIGSSAFSGCSGLTSITIPDSVTSIGNYAFSGCSGLTSITIPDSVTSIGKYAFSGCSGLTSITYNGTMAQWKTISRNDDWSYGVPSTTKVTCTDGTCGLDDK